MTHPGSSPNGNATTNSSVRSQQQLEWARGELSASHNASIEQIRSNFLRNLNDDSFVPFLSHQEALESLQTDAAGKELTRTPDEFLLAAAANLQPRVQEFRRELPQLPVMVRLFRWRALKRDSWCCPRAEAQLEELFPLLELDFEAIPADAPMLQRLAKFATETYGMPPKERANTLAANLAEINKAPNQWRLVARTLRQQSPQIADYADLLLRKTNSEPTTPVRHDQQRVRQRQATTDFIPVDNPTEGSGCGNRIGWVAAISLIVILRFAFSASHFTQSKSAYTPPKIPVVDYSPATGDSQFPVGTRVPNETWRVTPSALESEDFERSNVKSVEEQIEELRRLSRSGQFRSERAQFESERKAFESEHPLYHPGPMIPGDPNGSAPSIPRPTSPTPTFPNPTLPNPSVPQPDRFHP